MPRRNICGVCACQVARRSSVAATRPSRSAFRVSATGSASRPPTGSSRQASISASTHSARTRQRAASCTSTQSSLAGAAFEHRVQPARDALGAGRAAAARDRDVRRRSHQALEGGVARRQHDEHRVDAPHPGESGERVRDDRLAVERNVLLRQVRSGARAAAGTRHEQAASSRLRASHEPPRGAQRDRGAIGARVISSMGSASI